jgi:hypothetical protein
MPIATAQAVADRIIKLEASARDATTRADTAEAERDAAKLAAEEAAKKADNDDDLRARVDARLALERRAAPHFDETEWSEVRKLDDVDVMRTTIAKVHDGLELDGKSADYLAAAFDLLPAPKGTKRGDLDDLSRKVIVAPPRDDDGANEAQARVDKAMSADVEAWRRPVPGGYTKDGPTRHNPAERAE